MTQGMQSSLPAEEGPFEKEDRRNKVHCPGMIWDIGLKPQIM